ncbi:MAG: TrmH family RNA methyltransferase, partial [Ktedonobacterales bacterium]
LKKRGLWCIGLDGSAKTRFDQANLKGPIALVVGNEGKGISRLAREHCDLLINLPMRGHVGSLNAAVAGSIALYEIWRQRAWAMPAEPVAAGDIDGDMGGDMDAAGDGDGDGGDE